MDVNISENEHAAHFCLTRTKSGVRASLRKISRPAAAGIQSSRRRGFYRISTNVPIAISAPPMSVFAVTAS